MSTKTPLNSSSRPGQRLIFRPFITLRNGKKLYASAVGKKAWPIWVSDNEDKK